MQMTKERPGATASARPTATRLAQRRLVAADVGAPPGRRRYLFPLPAVIPPPSGRPAKRGMQQRLSRQRWLTFEVNSAVRELTDMSGCRHAAALRHLWGCFGSAELEGECPTPGEACIGRLGVSGSSRELPLNLASYQKGLASLPQGRAVLADLAELLPPTDRAVIANF